MESPVLLCTDDPLKGSGERWESYLCAAAVPYPMSVSRGEVIAS